MAQSKPLQIRASVFALVFLVCLVTSSPIALPEQPQDGSGDGLTWEIVGSNPNDIQCETDRSSDYYGLGVRLGIYMAWLTGWVANNWVPDEIPGAMDTNAIFLFALVIAMVRCTITNLVSQLDGLILMQLSLGTIFSVISIWGYRTCFYLKEGPRGIANFGGFGTHLRLLLCTAVSVYGLWFWYDGMMGSLEPGTGNCKVLYTFFFAKLLATGGIRIAYIIMFMASTVYFGIMTVVSIIGPISRICKMTWLAKYKFFRTSARLKYATGFNYGQLRYMFYFLRLANLFWIFFSIVKIEFTLNYNHVSSVLGENGRIFFPSQLIPTVIGACSLARVCYLCWETWRSPRDSKPSLAKTPSTPVRKEAIPRGKNILRLFAPVKESSGGDGEGGGLCLEDSDLDEEMVGTPGWWRNLVTWLPWLQAAIQWWRNRDEREGSTTDSGESALPTHEFDVTPDIEKGHQRRRETWDSENTLAATQSTMDRPESGKT